MTVERYRNAPATLTRKTRPKLLPTKLAGKGGTKRNMRRVKISNYFISGQLKPVVTNNLSRNK
jgi:hypothetical protein